jgi:hypothetical protein
MGKDNTTVILATPLAYPKPSKALSDVILSLPTDKMRDFYAVLSATFTKFGGNATVGNLPSTLQAAVIANYPIG